MYDLTDAGAHFHRTDLQVHTPRDNQWSGGRPTSDQDRAAYAQRFVEACRNKGLDAVAITDHHDFAFYPFIREAARQEVDDSGDPIPEHRRLVVFPGLELTLAVPCQAILVLDADIPLDRLEVVIQALAIEPVDPLEARLGSVTTIANSHSLSDVCKALDARAGVEGRYILLPNVTDGGYKSLMRSGMHEKYKEMPCVGGYIDGTVEAKVGRGNRDIFDGKDAKRGFKPLALFQTSDTRSESFETLGEPSSWVKWSAPTAEALRQACLAHESRISHTEPQLPTTFISRLEVSNSKFMGPVDLLFNPQYNAVIGGRGTGKSTLLDYIRWTLCDSALFAGAGAEPLEERARRLIENTLTPFEASVEVEFSINDITHVVRRHAGTGELQLRVGDGPMREASAEEVRQLLPIQSYSQKQLSTVAVRVSELTRFVTAGIRSDLAEIDQRATQTEAGIRETYASVQRFRALSSSVRRTELQVQSLKEQAHRLRSGLTGLTGEDQAILASKPEFDDAGAAFQAWLDAKERTQRLIGRLAEVLQQQIDELPHPVGAPAALAPQLTRYREQLVATSEQLRSAIEHAGEVFASVADDPAGMAGTATDLGRALAEYAGTYEDVKERSTAHAERLAELSDLERRQAAFEDTLRSESAELEALGDPTRSLTEQRRTLMELAVQRSELLEDRCHTLEGLSDGALRATLRRGQGLNGVVEAFRGFVSGSGLRAAKTETFFSELSSQEDPIATWFEVLGELETLASADAGAEVTTAAAPVAARLGLTSADLNRIVERSSPDGWLVLALTRVEDHPVFEYKTGEDDYIPFADASAGQQATALLRVLLAQAGPPLIIDQPEDDLDSQVIQEVATRLWAAKSHRQAIFASHNANLVVNGDADLVVCCDYRRSMEQSFGEIRAQGAIDREEVRRVITGVMEGGEKAFRLRKEKYGY